MLYHKGGKKKMKRGLFCLMVVAFVVGGNSMVVAKSAKPGDTVIQFFEASKNGDTETIKQLIAGSFYNQRKVLLEENKDYPNFLRKYYQGTELQIGNIIMEENGTVGVVDIKIQFPDGNVDTTKLLLKKDAGGIWKVVDEMHP
jgi:hypothetical protein